MGYSMVIFSDGCTQEEEMKIGINTLFLIPGEVGGTETYLRQTLLAMAEFCPGVSLVLFTNRENDPVLKKDLSGFKQVTFVRLDFGASNKSARITREQTELPGKVREAGVDVLWSLGYTAPFFSPCPQVVTIHDMQYKTYPEDLSFRARIVTDVLVKIAARRCRRSSITREHGTCSAITIPRTAFTPARAATTTATTTRTRAG